MTVSARSWVIDMNSLWEKLPSTTHPDRVAALKTSTSSKTPHVESWVEGVAFTSNDYEVERKCAVGLTCNSSRRISVPFSFYLF
jgi:hypothetical protein